MTGRSRNQHPVLDTLITSKTRLKLLLKFFLNSNTTSYLRDLEGEFGESTNAIRIELNRFEHAGLLHAEPSGNKKMFRANTNHPLYSDINSLLRKYVGIDHIVERVVSQLGGIESAFITGNFAHGLDSKHIDLILVGTNVNTGYLTELITRAEEIVKRTIQYSLVPPDQAEIQLLQHPEALLLWSSEQ